MSLKLNPSYGPKRLPGVESTPSLIYCITSCISRFPDDCHSVIYNAETHLCTPGQRLDPSEPKPSPEEGDLYITHQCDSVEGFTLYSYGTTLACVFYQTIRMNYTRAQNFCASLDSHLYTVKSMDKYYLLQNIFQDGLWVGLDDVAEEGVYVWSDGEIYDNNLTALMFMKNEPNNYQDSEDCIGMLQPKPPKLNDDACYKNYDSVCERPV